MKKQFLSALLAGTCAVSMAVPVAASTAPEVAPPQTAATADITAGAEGTTVVLTGKAGVPVIKVSVPTTAGFLVNPYKITVGDSNKQIVAPELKLTNNTAQCKAQVDMTVTAEQLGAAVIIPPTVQDDGTVVAPVTPANAEAENYGAKWMTLKIGTAAAAADVPTDFQWLGGDAVTVSCELAKKDDTGASKYVIIDGEAESNPTEAWSAGTGAAEYDGDGANITIVYNIRPLVNGGAAGGGPAAVTADTAAQTLTISGTGITSPTMASGTTAYTVAGAQAAETYTFAITQSGYTATLAKTGAAGSVAGLVATVGNSSSLTAGSSTNIFTLTITSDTNPSDKVDIVVTFTV